MTISILCGGSGTRLFPLSRDYAKAVCRHSRMEEQFTFTFPEETLLRNTFLIKEHNAKFQVITNDNHYFIAQEQAQKCDIPLQDFILESYGKNTAPALTFASPLRFKSYKSK